MRKAIQICVAFFCALPFFGEAQTKIRILSSEITDIKKKDDGSRVYYLRGNVGLQQDEAKMYCDSAILIQPQNTFEAFSNVRIVQADTTMVTGEELFYEGDKRLFTISKNVVLTTPSSTLRTTSLRFDRNTRTGYYTTRSTLYRKGLELTSDIGSYNTQSQTVRLRGEVEALDPDYTLKTDTLLYYPKANSYRFLGPSTLLRDSSLTTCKTGRYNADEGELNLGKGASITSPKSFIKADSISYNLKLDKGSLYHKALVSDSTKGFVLEADFIKYIKEPNYVDAHYPVFYRQSLDADTLFAKGDTLTIREDTNGARVVNLLETTSFYSEKFQGQSSFFSYHEAFETLSLFPNPLLWGDKSQFSCDSALLLLQNEELDSLYLHQNVKIVSESKDSAYFDAASGKFLYGSFESNSLSRIKLEGNAQSIMHNFSSGPTPDGINKTACSWIETNFEAGEVKTVRASKSVEASYIPWNSGGQAEATLPGCLPEFDQRTKPEDVKLRPPK